MKKYLIISCLLCSFCKAYALEILPTDVKSQNAYFKANEGKGIGYRKGYTSLGLLYNFEDTSNKTIQPYIDARCHYFNDNRWATNLGFGARYFSLTQQNLLGWNIFYDFRQRHQ